MDRKLLALSLLALAAVAAFMVLGAKGNWGFILTFRGIKLIGLVAVAVSIGVATIVFQTLTANRILTPSIMGFDALYILLQTAMVFLFGGLGYAMIPSETQFLLELVLLTGAALALFGTLMGTGLTDLFRMLLIGVVFGVLFRSLSAVLQRIIDPSEFAYLQAMMFASFNHIDKALLVMAVPLIVLCCTVVWYKRSVFDVMALGREQAIGLGVNYRRELVIGLVLVTALVATSTALVGPVAFFGILVSSISYEIMRTHNHGPVFVAAGLIAIIILVGGQAVFERVLGLAGTLSIVIEFLGGLVFLYLILRKARA